MNNILQESFSFIKNLPFLSRKSKSSKKCNTNRRPFERPTIKTPEQLTMNFNKNEVKNEIKKAIAVDHPEYPTLMTNDQFENKLPF